MPKFIEIGEVALQLARKMAPSAMESAEALMNREVTTLLAQGRTLSPESLKGLSRLVGSAAKEFQPLHGIKLESAVREEGTFVVGKPIISGGHRFPELKIYEPHHNITIRNDGSFNVAAPTPSGQKVVHRDYEWKGNYAEAGGEHRYSESLRDPYPKIDLPGDYHGATYGFVTTHGNARQFEIGARGWSSGKNNFSPNNGILDTIKTAKPVNVSDEAISKLVGANVTNPVGNGWLVGFDKKSGEALVSYGNRPEVGFNVWDPRNLVVKNLDGLYPVDLAMNGASNMTAYRNALGRVFEPRKVEGGFSLAPASQLFAFKPSEVGLHSGRLSKLLGLESQVGLRALGGYDTIYGGRIPIGIGGF